MSFVSSNLATILSWLSPIPALAPLSLDSSLQALWPPLHLLQSTDLTSCFTEKTEAKEVGEALKPSSSLSPLGKKGVTPLTQGSSPTCAVLLLSHQSPVSLSLSQLHPHSLHPFHSHLSPLPYLLFTPPPCPTAPTHTGLHPEDTSLVHPGHLSSHMASRCHSLRFLTPCQFPLLLLPYVPTAQCKSSLRRVL